MLSSTISCILKELWEKESIKELIKKGYNPENWIIYDDGSIYSKLNGLLLRNEITPFKGSKFEIKNINTVIAIEKTIVTSFVSLFVCFTIFNTVNGPTTLFRSLSILWAALSVILLFKYLKNKGE